MWLRKCLFFSLAIVLWGCATQKKMEDLPDSYGWLEEVEGEKAISWVKNQNKKSLDVLEKDKNYQTYFDETKKILTAKDRIPYARIYGGFAYNFWQDKKNIRGVWRRSSILNYKNKKNRWDTLLDVDKLAKSEKKIGYTRGQTVCLPSFQNV